MTLRDFIDAAYGVMVTHLRDLGFAFGDAVTRVEDALKPRDPDGKRPKMTREEAAIANQAAIRRLEGIMSGVKA